MISSEDVPVMEPDTMQVGYAVQTSGLVKRFGDRTAVNQVDLRVPAGTGCPSSRIDPEPGLVSPSSIRISVVFPAPFGPR